MLIIAGIYNLLWGSWVIFCPRALFEWAQIEPPNYLPLWQCVGMIVGVYGIGYLVAARDLLRHWPMVLVGLLGKIFGPLGFVWSAAHGALPWRWGVILIFNDLIWWLPFAGVLLHAFRNADRLEVTAR